MRRDHGEAFSKGEQVMAPEMGSRSEKRNRHARGGAAPRTEGINLPQLSKSQFRRLADCRNARPAGFSFSVFRVDTLLVYRRNRQAAIHGVLCFDPKPRSRRGTQAAMGGVLSLDRAGAGQLSRPKLCACGLVRNQIPIESEHSQSGQRSYRLSNVNGLQDEAAHDSAVESVA
jgi:hypothetical protein